MKIICVKPPKAVRLLLRLLVRTNEKYTLFCRAGLRFIRRPAFCYAANFPRAADSLQKYCLHEIKIIYSRTIL